MSELLEAAEWVVREFLGGKASVSQELFDQLSEPAFMALHSLQQALIGERGNVIADGPIGPASRPVPYVERDPAGPLQFAQFKDAEPNTKL